jgi:hypothetical protein
VARPAVLSRLPTQTAAETDRMLLPATEHIAVRDQAAIFLFRFFLYEIFILE